VAVETIVLALIGFAVIVWIVRHIEMSAVNRKGPFIRAGGSHSELTRTPLVSVIVPARNEEENIAECLKSIFNQDYPNLEVTVVNDRSTDRTAEIVHSLCEQRLKEGKTPCSLVNIKELPEGWTGKTYALHSVTAKAKGEWLLFIDADTRHHPSNISRMMEAAQKENLDMLSLLPGLESKSFWERAMQPILAGALMVRYPIELVNNPRSRIAFANGQYIMIKKSVYEAVGGHEAVRHNLLEDIALARRVKNFHREVDCKAERPFAVKLFLGSEVTTTRMYDSFRRIWKGWSRIFYGAYNRSAPMVLLLICMVILLSASPLFVFLGSLICEVAGVGAPFVHQLLLFSGVHLALMLTGYFRFYKYVNGDPRFVLFTPVAALVGVGILTNTLAKILFAQDISWRGTNYATNSKK